MIGSESRRCLRGRGGHIHAVYMQRWLATGQSPIGAAAHKGQPPAGTIGYDQPVGAIANGQPARSCHPCIALSLVGVVAPTAGVAAAWQGGCRPQRVTAACAGVAVGAAATVVQ
ncbi:hypothetical protein B296_00005601 [Ensete ventricosum]|uniref:Uncharacterized protein n=1 Tax=Ensete ventricosum TaxID=4639 RepID=A0A426YG71_ENSVE|nr:hypothetical protein B296_00005601 [Ensete ventricosum]